MAPKDKPPTGPPKIDRANQINSMSKIMKNASESAKKQQQMSRNINTLMVKQLEEQKNLGKNKRTPLAESKDVKEITNSVNEILKKLGYVVDNLSQGVKKITVETARATKEAVQQYGEAISSDISINKQNVVAMAIAKSSPILGYFTSKFFETAVFKNMAEKVRSKFHDVFSSVSDRFKIMFSRMVEGIKDFFGFGKRGRERIREIKERPRKIPALQAGGYVEKGGIARLHAAEVVIPVDKFLKTLRDSFAMAKEDNKRIIDELRLLRYGLTGAKSEFGQRLTKAFMDIPLVRGYLATQKILSTVRTFFTKARGKYRKLLPEGSASLGSVTSILGLIFTHGMYKLDVIIHHLATLIKGLTGAEPTIPSMANPTTKADDLKVSSIWIKYKSEGIKEAAKETGRILRDRISDMASKIPMVGKFFGKGKGGKVKEDTKEKSRSIISNILRFASSPQEAYAMISEAVGSAKAKLMQSKAVNFRDVIREKGEKFKAAITRYRKTPAELTAEMKEKIDSIANTTKSIAKSMWQWTKAIATFPFKAAWYTLKSIPVILKTGFKTIKDVTGAIKDVVLLFVMPAISGLVSTIGKGVSLFAQLFKHLGGLKFLGKIGRLGGAAAGAITGIIDMLEGLSKSKEWFGEGAGKSEDISSGIGAFLGGTKSGFEGLMHGAIKGIGFGFSIAGPKGAAIGGAIGAILGFIGGERIAKAINPVVNLIMDFCDMVASIFGKAVDWLKEQRKEIAEKGLFGWISAMISSTAGREYSPESYGAAGTGEAIPMAGDAYPRTAARVSALGASTEDALMIRNAILEGYSVVGKIVKEEMEDKKTMAGIGGIAGTATTVAGAAPSLFTPAVTPTKAQAVIEDSNKALVQHAAQFLAGGTASLTDAVVQRAGKGVHLEGMNPEFASRFAGMAKEYMDQTGKKITVTDAFRSSEEQARLYAMKPHLAAPPGRSRHEKGMAMDIDTPQANQLYASGLMEKYGFYRPMYPPWGGGPGRKTEGWHLELAKGAQIGDAWPAVKMSQKDIARMQVGDAFAGADMLASTVGANSAALRGALSGFGRETSTVLVNMTNVISNAVQNAVSNKQGGGSSTGQTDPMLQNILTGNFG